MINLIENPRRSTRQLSNNVKISATTIRRIIKKNKFHQFKIQLYQEINETDFLPEELTFVHGREEY